MFIYITKPAFFIKKAGCQKLSKIDTKMYYMENFSKTKKKN